MSAWGLECEKAIAQSVQEYIESTIVLIQCDYDTAPIENRLKKVPFMNEPGRKLFVYDSLTRDPVDWATIKRLKRSFFTGAKVTMQLTQVGDEAGDTLAVLKMFTRHSLLKGRRTISARTSCCARCQAW